jgi:ABC-type multidrug transport system fused ATPase/permease subunit
MNLRHDKNLMNILLAIGLIMVFVFIVSISIYLVQDKLLPSCVCSFSFPIIISVLASLGVFVGIFTYYFLSKSFLKEKEKIYVNAEKTLNFLDKEERKILETLIEKKGSCSQAIISKLTNIDSVKIFRRLLNLENKGIIIKEKSGMTNKIILNKDYMDLFVK